MIHPEMTPGSYSIGDKGRKEDIMIGKRQLTIDALYAM
jgi:hypothetical protein